MTIPTYQTHSTNSTTATTCTVPVPGTPQLDDLLLCVFLRNNMTSLSSVANGSLNFNQLYGPTAAPSGSSMRQAAWWRRCDGTETGSITSTVSLSTSQRQTNICFLIRGVDWSFNSGVPIAGSAGTGSSTTNLDPPNVNVPGSVNRDFLSIVTVSDIGPAITFTGSYTGIITTGNLTSTGINTVAAQKNFTSTSSEDPAAFTTSSSTSFIASTILLIGPNPAGRTQSIIF